MAKNPSTDSISEATQERAEFSGHKNAKGAAGYRDSLSGDGQTAIIQAEPSGFGRIRIGAAWDNITLSDAGFFSRLIKKITREGIDIDLGCLYEMKDGRRGCIQAFGDMFGDFDHVPFISLSGDERTGNASGDDEFMKINGKHWNEINRILIYVYIYHGQGDWSMIRPNITVSVGDEAPLLVVPQVRKSELSVCAIATLENTDDSIRITNHTEYFPGHAEMDRAYGFGLEWDDGRK